MGAILAFLTKLLSRKLITWAVTQLTVYGAAQGLSSELAQGIAVAAGALLTAVYIWVQGKQDEAAITTGSPTKPIA